jgi:hypothetical protein
VSNDAKEIREWRQEDTIQKTLNKFLVLSPPFHITIRKEEGGGEHIRNVCPFHTKKKKKKLLLFFFFGLVVKLMVI